MCEKHKKYKGDALPKNNCHTCWQMFYIKHPGNYVALKSAMDKIPRSHLVSSFGSKFVKSFERVRAEWESK